MQKDLPFALQKTESPKLYSVISVPFYPFQPHVSPSQAHFSSPVSTTNGKVQYCPQRWLESQEQKEESWYRVERMGKAGAYLWLTDWRLTGLGQWNPVCLWVWSVIWLFQLVSCLWVSPYFLSTVWESQGSEMQKSTLISVVWTWLLVKS